MASSGCSDSGLLAIDTSYDSGGTIDRYLVYSIKTGERNRLCGVSSSPDLIIWAVRGKPQIYIIGRFAFL